MNFFRRTLRRFCGLAGLLLVAVILYPVFTRSRENAKRSSCQSNLMQIGLSLMQYSQDYNEKSLPVRSGGAHGIGWALAIQPYVKSTQILQCPQERSVIQDDPRRRFYSDYWMNANLSGIELKKILDPAATILCGDGNDGSDQSDASYNISALPPQWISDSQSPLYRHYGKANYLFSDGHVKAAQPQEITRSGGKYHFLAQ